MSNLSLDTGTKPVGKTTSRLVSEAFSFLDDKDHESSNVKGSVHTDPDQRNGGIITNNKNGIYTIVTSVDELVPPPKCEGKPYGRPTSDNDFRIVDYVSDKKAVDQYINPVYVVEDDSIPSNSLRANGAIDHVETATNDKSERSETISSRNNEERNSVNIDGEEVFLRKSPKEQKARSSRQQTWKNNQIIVSEAFGFLKDVPGTEEQSTDLVYNGIQEDNPEQLTEGHISRSARQPTWKSNQKVVSQAFDFLKDVTELDENKRVSSNLYEETIEESDSHLSPDEQISRAARQPTWKANQRIVSQAFDFLKEVPGVDERLSNTSIDDSAESNVHLQTPHASSDQKTSNSSRKESEHDQEKADMGNVQNNESQLLRSQSDVQSQTSNQNSEFISTNQNEESKSANHNYMTVISNQNRVSETSSIASEDLGDLGGYKKSKFRSRDKFGDDEGDSSDEDVGVYRESFRKSTWLYIGDKTNKDDKLDNLVPLSELGLDTCDTDNVFGSASSGPRPSPDSAHKRSSSTSTTVSEREFRNHFNSVSKRFVKRADSQQEYKRYTQKFYDNVETYNIEKTDRDSYGIHILDSKPAIVSGVDAGSPAEKAGLKEGQVVIAINGVNVLESDHDEIIQLVHTDSLNLKLEVGSGDLSPVLNLQLPVQTGYLQKQVSSTIFRLWKKRYFILRRDNCLYYYKNEQDKDPLGAIPLYGYTVSRHGDTNKYGFKAEKYNSKSYYFLADSRDDMTRWVGALNETAKRQDDKRDAWMEVTAHNVGLPALDIRKPDCSGYLNKMGRSTKRWRKRYCVLKDACIYYYKNSSSKEALGVAHLHGYTVDNLGVSTKKLSFCLQPPEEQMRVFIFYAENETDKLRWIDALNTSIQKWVKVD